MLANANSMSPKTPTAMIVFVALSNQASVETTGPYVRYPGSQLQRSPGCRTERSCLQMLPAKCDPQLSLADIGMPIGNNPARQVDPSDSRRFRSTGRALCQPAKSSSPAP